MSFSPLVCLSLFATLKLRVTAKEALSVERSVWCSKVGHIAGCVTNWAQREECPNRVYYNQVCVRVLTQLSFINLCSVEIRVINLF